MDERIVQKNMAALLEFINTRLGAGVGMTADDVRTLAVKALSLEHSLTSAGTDQAIAAFSKLLDEAERTMLALQDGGQKLPHLECAIEKAREALAMMVGQTSYWQKPDRVAEASRVEEEKQ